MRTLIIKVDRDGKVIVSHIGPDMEPDTGAMPIATIHLDVVLQAADFSELSARDILGAFFNGFAEVVVGEHTRQDAGGVG